MSMAIEHRPQAQFGAMGYNMRFEQPQFTNPWSSAGSAPNPAYAAAAHSYSAPLPDPSSVARSSSLQIPYSSAAQSNGSAFQPAVDFASQQQQQQQQQRYTPQFATSASPAQASFAPTSAPRYSPEYSQAQPVGQYAYDQEVQRRQSFQPSQAARNSISEAIDASRGIMHLSQQDMTPRNIYGTGHSSRQGSQDSYGFPSAHSSTSSMSGASGYPSSYYPGSYSGSIGDGSMTEYSSASEEVVQRPLPAPSQLISGFPPEPSTMMHQFSSKSSPNAQKKHKCKICEKRFTRPSSLQTHMYSHTGEKPFACEVDGCGRHFSVISNLRRHRKVHKDDPTASIDSSEE